MRITNTKKYLTGISFSMWGFSLIDKIPFTINPFAWDAIARSTASSAATFVMVLAIYYNLEYWGYDDDDDYNY